MKVDSVSLDTEITDGNSIKFDTLSPSFAARYGEGHFRWVNVVNLHSYHDDMWALSYPSNLEDRTIPRLRGLIGLPVITREGWVLGQQYKGSQEWFHLSDGLSAITEWFERKGIKAEQSSAGNIAKQVISSLGSLWGGHLIAHPKIICLLNKMAAQEVVRGADNEATRRQFEGRTVIAPVWKALINKLGKDRLSRLELDDFAKHGILKLGLGVECPNCGHGNWYGLNTVDYEITCDRCLKDFQFPQGDDSARWKYRVTGPFSVPNFAEGAYAVVLTLNLFKMKIRRGAQTQLTYSTGLNLNHRDFKREIDFAFWYDEKQNVGQRSEPRFVFGEAKSFANEAIAETDIQGLRQVAQVAPGALIVVAVMKDVFSTNEKVRLARLVQWGWRLVDGRPRAQVLLLTGVELFADFHIDKVWEEAGDPYPKNSRYRIFNDLDEFARTTQRIHLGLDYYKWLKNRMTKKKINQRAGLDKG